MLLHILHPLHRLQKLIPCQPKQLIYLIRLLAINQMPDTNRHMAYILRLFFWFLVIILFLSICLFLSFNNTIQFINSLLSAAVGLCLWVCLLHPFLHPVFQINILLHWIWLLKRRRSFSSFTCFGSYNHCSLKMALVTKSVEWCLLCLASLLYLLFCLLN